MLAIQIERLEFADLRLVPIGGVLPHFDLTVAIAVELEEFLGEFGIALGERAVTARAAARAERISFVLAEGRRAMTPPSTGERQIRSLTKAPMPGGVAQMISK